MSWNSSCPALDSDPAEAAPSQRWLRAGAWQHVTSLFFFFLLHHFDRWVTGRQGDKRVWVLQGMLFAERERNPHSTGRFVVLVSAACSDQPVLGEQGRGKGKELCLKCLVLLLVKAEMPHAGRHAFGPLQRPDFPNELMSLLQFLITLLCRSNRRSCVSNPNTPTTGPAHTARGILPSSKTPQASTPGNPWGACSPSLDPQGALQEGARRGEATFWPDNAVELPRGLLKWMQGAGKLLRLASAPCYRFCLHKLYIYIQNSIIHRDE